MLKRAIFYGLAFGSLSAAMLLVQYLNGLYKVRSFVSSLPLIFNIIIPAFGVYLFIKALMQLKLEKPINMGKALFGALIMSTVVALCNIAAFQHIHNNEIVVMKEFRALQYNAIEKNVQLDSNITQDQKASKISERISKFEENFSVSSFAMNQMEMCLSVGMIVALLVFVKNYRVS